MLNDDELKAIADRRHTYSESSACATPIALSTPTTACGIGVMDTSEASAHACAFPRWIPAAEWDEKGPDPANLAIRYQGQWVDRPQYEDDIPIYRWESNIKGVDTWAKINDAAGDDTLIGEQSSLISQSRMVVTRNNSDRHSDEHLLKMLGAHPKR